MPQFHRDVD